MPQPIHIFDLSTLDLRPGEARNIDAQVRMDPATLGGQDYAVGNGTVEARVEVSRTTDGYALRMRFAAELAGSCMRCLEPASLAVEVDSREVDQPGDDEDLHSPYLEESELDTAAWARDALVLELPAQIVCRPDCLGLCAVCGVDLNGADPADHRHETGGDPRWAKLRELTDG